MDESFEREIVIKAESGRLLKFLSRSRRPQLSTLSGLELLKKTCFSVRTSTAPRAPCSHTFFFGKKPTVTPFAQEAHRFVQSQWVCTKKIAEGEVVSMHRRCCWCCLKCSRTLWASRTRSWSQDCLRCRRATMGRNHGAVPC